MRRVPDWVKNATLTGTVFGVAYDRKRRWTWAGVGGLIWLTIEGYNEFVEQKVIEQVLEAGRDYSQPIDLQGEQ